MIPKNIVFLKLYELDCHVYHKNGKRFVFDQLCKKEVELNGPGTHDTWYASIATRMANIFTSEFQKLMLPVSDVHDFQTHRGVTENENILISKQYRKNGYAVLKLKFSNEVKNLRTRIKIYGISGNWWDKNIKTKWLLFKIKSLQKKWKKYEGFVEFHYTILRATSHTFAVHEKCWKEND